MKIIEKVLKPLDKLVAETDYNPDIVFLYGRDCFNKGTKLGILISSTATLVTAGVIWSIYGLLKFKEENESKKEEDYEEV